MKHSVLAALIINPYAFAAVPGAPPSDPEWGIASEVSGTSLLSSTWQMGWEFTVGADDLTVTRLRTYARSIPNRRVRLWRIADAALLADVTVPYAAFGWNESADLETPVVLTSGQNYLVTTHASGANMSIPYLSNAASLTYNGVTFVRGRGGNVSTMPGGDYTQLYGIPDFLFTR